MLKNLTPDSLFTAPGCHLAKDSVTSVRKSTVLETPNKSIYRYGVIIDLLSEISPQAYCPRMGPSYSCCQFPAAGTKLSPVGQLVGFLVQSSVSVLRLQPCRQSRWTVSGNSWSVNDWTLSGSLMKCQRLDPFWGSSNVTCSASVIMSQYYNGIL